MNRRLTLALAVLASFAPAIALGLGLGDIRLHSALNQPLDAEIDLLAATDDEVNSIKVRLASPDQFDRYGIDRIAALASLKFDVVKRPNGRAYVHITSDQALREPFLTFLIEASWPRGRLLREYTVLHVLFLAVLLALLRRRFGWALAALVPLAGVYPTFGLQALATLGAALALGGLPPLTEAVAPGGPPGVPRGRRALPPVGLAVGAAARHEPRQRTSLRHECGRLALQPRRRSAGGAEHSLGPARRRGAQARR